jgi:site-specific recombinase XerD
MEAPVITIFVRHSADCKYHGDEFCKRCNCRKHLRWTQNGTQYRRKAGCRSWAAAEEKKRELEDQLTGRIPVAPTDESKLIDEAVQVFKTDKENQKVTDGVLEKYIRELERLRSFAQGKGVFTVAGLTRELLIDYRATWDELYPSSNTRQMVQARLKNFLRFCYDSKWLERVPRLSAIQADEAPTLPLSAKEYQKLLTTIPKTFSDVVHIPKSDKMPEHTRASVIKERAGRIRALIQLMRYSGLAIRDAVTLERSELMHDKAKGFYRMVTARQKTGTHVSVPIPNHIAEELLAVLNGNPKYFFWTGNGEERTAVSHYQDDLRQLFNDAGLQSDGYMVSHRLRDTFAVDLLEKGIPLEEVSKLLGHESIKTTERHYAKWVKGRQDRLDSLVSATWKK